MGKKTKKVSPGSPKKEIPATIPKGGSVISKNKPVKSPQPAKQQNNKKQNQNGKTPTNVEAKTPKKQTIAKPISQDKLKEIAANVTKTAKQRKRNKKKNVSADEIKTNQVNTEAKPEVQGTEDSVKLTKRLKTRLKSEIKKEIILKGKSSKGLADPKLVAKKLAKLKNKPEPLSKKAKRKIVLLESLHERLIKGEKNELRKAHKEPPAAELKEASDEEMPQEKKPKKQNGNIAAKKLSEPDTNDNFYVFIGNLQADITDDMIREHFKSAGVIQKVKIPEPRRRKSKRFAYLQLSDDVGKQKALDLHGSMLGPKKITVLYACKKKGKGGLMSKNAKLNALRKASGQINEVSATKKTNKKQKKPKAVAAK